MLKARDLMSPHVIAVGPDDPVQKAISLMLRHRLGGLPVVDGSGRLLGMLSEFDLLDLVWAPQTGGEVYQYMTRDVHAVDEEAGLSTVAERLRQWGVGRLPVTSDGRLVGMVCRGDVLRHLPPPVEQIPSAAVACKS